MNLKLILTSIASGTLAVTLAPAITLAYTITCTESQQQIAVNYTCSGGGEGSYTQCNFDSTNTNTIQNSQPYSPLATLMAIPRLGYAAGAQSMTCQQQVGQQQITVNYTCNGGGANSYTFCYFSSVNSNTSCPAQASPLSYRSYPAVYAAAQQYLQPYYPNYTQQSAAPQQYAPSSYGYGGLGYR